MHSRPSRHRQRWRVWIIQLALLCFVGLHAIGVLHKHASAAEHDACVACQVVDHQALDVPDAVVGLLYSLLVLLFLALPGYRSPVLGAEFFRRPPSRAPPLSLLS